MDTPNDLPRRSLYDCADAEARRYKWIESEKAGHDLGEAAIRQWVQRHWARFLRERWIEHLEGRVFWDELDRGDFGLLRQHFGDTQVGAEILRRLRGGGENLDILCWTHECDLNHEEVWEVLEILETLDINEHRIECHLAPCLSHAG